MTAAMFLSEKQRERLSESIAICHAESSTQLVSVTCQPELGMVVTLVTVTDGQRFTDQILPDGSMAEVRREQVS